MSTGSSLVANAGKQDSSLNLLKKGLKQGPKKRLKRPWISSLAQDQETCRYVSTILSALKMCDDTDTVPGS